MFLIWLLLWDRKQENCSFNVLLHVLTKTLMVSLLNVLYGKKDFLNMFHMILVTMLWNLLVLKISTYLFIFFNVLQHQCRCCDRTLCAEHSSSQMACLLSLYMHLNRVTHCNNFWPIIFLLRAIFRPYHNLVFIHSSEFAMIVLMMPLGNFLSLWIIMVFFLDKF